MNKGGGVASLPCDETSANEEGGVTGDKMSANEEGGGITPGDETCANKGGGGVASLSGDETSMNERGGLTLLP